MDNRLAARQNWLVEGMPRRTPSIPVTLRALADRQEGLVSIEQCRRHGLTTRLVAGMAQRGQIRRVARGVYDLGAPASSPFDRFDRRRRRAAFLGVLARPGSVVTGAAALVLHEVQGAPLTITPEVTFPDGSPRRGVGPGRLRRTRLTRWCVIDEIRCAHPEDALVQAVPTVDRRHAVAMMDSARNRGLLAAQEFASAQRRDASQHGGRGRRSWWQASDDRAESPAETWGRDSAAVSGFAPDALQLRVVDQHDRFLARVDLAWLLPDGVLLVEVDGHDVHARLEALFSDRVRQNRLTGKGVRLLRFTGREAGDGTLAQVVADHLSTAGWSPRPVPRSFRYRVA